jgi:hypothetical protein
MANGHLAKVEFTFSFLKNEISLNLPFSSSIYIQQHLKYTLKFNDNTAELSSRDFSISQSEKEIDILLNLVKFPDFKDGIIIIDRVDSTEQFDYAGCFPIVVKNIVNSNNGVFEALKTVLKSTQKTSSGISGLSLPVLITQGASIASTPNKVISSFLYFRFLNGPTIIYLELLFEYLSGMDFFSLFMSNPFASSGTSGRSTPEKYNIHSVKSNILFNYGLDALYIFTIFVLCSTISLSFRLGFFKAHRKVSFKVHSAQPVKLKSLKSDLDRSEAISSLSPRSTVSSTKKISFSAKKSSFGTIICKKYGIRYVIYEYATTSLEFLNYCILNIWTMTAAGWSLIGFFLSIIMFSTLTLIFYFAFAFYKQLKAKMPDNNSSPIQLPKPVVHSLFNLKSLEQHKKELEQVVDFDSLKYSVVGILYEGYDAELKRGALLGPMVDLTRAILIPALLLILNSTGIAQVIIVLLVEIAHCVFTIYYRVKARIVERILDIGNSVVIILFLLLRCISFSNMDEETLQNRLGLLMTGLLVLTLVANLLFVFCYTAIVMVIIPIIASLQSKNQRQLPASIHDNIGKRSGPNLPERKNGSKPSILTLNNLASSAIFPNVHEMNHDKKALTLSTISSAKPILKVRDQLDKNSSDRRNTTGKSRKGSIFKSFSRGSSRRITNPSIRRSITHGLGTMNPPSMAGPSKQIERKYSSTLYPLRHSQSHDQ